MASLLDRLRDPVSSGVYRATRWDTIADAVRGSRLNLGRIALEGVKDKDSLLQRIAEALGFPDWFGRNWDALEDCLTDLSWRAAGGHVLLFEGVGLLQDVEEYEVLIDVLASAAAFWAARERCFFAVFVDPDGILGLAELSPDA
jgi:hypothetical protein